MAHMIQMKGRSRKTLEIAQPSFIAALTQNMACLGTKNFPLILFASSLLLSCAENELSHMTQIQLLSAIEKNAAPTIVDVRSESEYQTGHVPGALHLPFYAIWTRHAEIKRKTDDPIILYCEHGPRAGIAKFAFWTLGYTNLAYLEGHMAGWKERELPMRKI